MQEKDKQSILYLSDPARIADLLNICLYLGETPLDGPRCLKDILQLEGLPEDAYDFLSVFSNTKELDEIKTIHNKKECDMCKAIKDLMEIGRNEGIQLTAQVIHMNADGKNETAIAEACQVSIEKIQEILQLFQ